MTAASPPQPARPPAAAPASSRAMPVIGATSVRLPGEHFAAAVLYLVSPAGAYVTGSTLLVDGGTSLIGAGPFLDMMLGTLTL